MNKYSNIEYCNIWLAILLRIHWSFKKVVQSLTDPCACSITLLRRFTKLHFQLINYISLCAESKSNSKACEFAYILDLFSLCLTRCKIKKYRQRQLREKQKHKSKRKRKINSAWLCLILLKCTGSVNCVHADRVTSNIYRAHFWFL